MDGERAATSICELLERWAYTQPDHVAISLGSRNISYGRLDAAASHIAGLLRQQQVRPGDFVPVLATHSIEMVACFFGVIKSGACYVPIDIEAWREERIATALKRVSARLVIDLGAPTRAAHPPLYSVVPCADITAAFEHDIRFSQYHGHPGTQLSDLAYMIFTSGTTAAPKGVMIPHSAILNYALQGDDETPFNFNANPSDRVLHLFSPGFDACAGVMVSALYNGAQLVIAGAHDLLECAARSTILVATPSVLAALGEPEAAGTQARTVILGGEAPSLSLLQKWWAPTRSIYNAYGPTETTVMSMIGRAVPGRPVTLGQPMKNSRVVLRLDGNDAELDDCDFGEMCITGPGLAVGFYQNEALTAERFITLKSGERAYRTGDFARRTEHGFEFAGRIDSLVKKHGFLINLEAQVIPALLAQGASEAAAFMHQKQLVGIVTPESLDVREMREVLSRKHEDYLVPDQMRALHALPLTANGKVDTHALQRLLAMEERKVQKHLHLDQVECSHGPRARMSRMETLKGAVAAAVSLPLDCIVEDCSFWELGGNSLAAIRLLALQEIEAEGDAGAPQDQYEGQLSQGLMTSLQTKIVQDSLRTPGLNYMLLHLRIPGFPAAPSELESMKAAWQQALQRHSTFRTSFLLKGGRKSGLRQLKADESSEDSYLPVNAFRLITVPDQASTLLWAVHHAQVDGWSLSIVINDVQAILHGSGRSALPPCLSPEDPSIRLVSVQRQLQGDPAGFAFWTRVLSDNQAAFLELPLAKGRSPSRSSSSPSTGWMSNHTLSMDLSIRDFEKAARRFRVVPSALMYLAWGLVLSDYTLSDHVAFGAVFSGRNLTTKAVPGVAMDLDVERAVGLLINMVPFPIQFGTGQQTISECATSVHNHLLETMEFQWSATEAMATMRGESINGILHTVLATEYDVPPLRGDWSVEHQDLLVEFGLSLMVEKQGSDGLRVRGYFDASRYASPVVSSVLRHFRNALKGFVDPRNMYILDVRLGLLEGSERAALIRPPATMAPYGVPRTVKEALEAAAAQWPNLCALESAQDGTMSYGELDEASNKLSRMLRSLMEGKAPGKVVVGVLTDRSLPWVVAVVAVLKAGCVCCPLDVTFPERRIMTMVKQSGASIFLAANRHCSRQFGSEACIVVDEFLQGAAQHEATAVETITHTADVIYWIFTSGTTGAPKGVPLHNLNILQVIENPDVRLAAAPGSDIATLEMFGTLCYGGTLVLKEHADPFEHLKRLQASVVTPSVLSACLPADYPLLDTVVIGGEAVPQSMAELWGAGRSLRNGYGPSHALPRVSVYVLDHRQCPVAQGITGEICISGAQMTRGYWGESAQDEARHVPNPFAASQAQQLLFYTSDLGYWDNDMRLSYVGRIDNQVKIRGFRVELAEIEQAILASDLDPCVQTAVAIVVDDHAEDGGESDTGEYAGDRKRVVCFVALQTVNLAALRSGISAVLPCYMRPSQLIALPELPTTSNYKADRKVLAALAASHWSGAFLTAIEDSIQEDSDPEHDETGLTTTEKMISTTWKELLHLDPRVQLQKEQDFLTIGGNSVLAIRAARQLASLVGRHVPVALLLRSTTLKELALAIDEYGTPRLSANLETESFSAYLSSPLSHPVSGDIVSKSPHLSYLEEELFYSHQASDTRCAFNTVIQSVLSGAIVTKALVESFTAVLCENPILRARYPTDAQGRPYRLISNDVTDALCIAGNEWSDEKMQALADRPFDLARDQLVRLVIWNRRDDSGSKDSQMKTVEMTVITHHIITDRASLSLLLQLMGRHYQALRAHSLSGETAAIPSSRRQKPKHRETDSAEWSQWLQTHQQTPCAQMQQQKKIAFWRDLLRSWQHTRILPSHDPCLRPHGPSPEMVVHYRGASEHLPIARPCGSSDGPSYSQRFAVAATALALRAVFATGDVTLAIPYMNRDDPATADMLGLFVDRLPIRLDLSVADLASAPALLDTIASATHRAIEHQIPYAQIRDEFSSPHEHFIEALVIYNWHSDALDRAWDLGPGVQVTP
ncbi:nonribosomal peptide synthetase hasD [Aspergillus alliaceus]|uniref:nonribosomal peptide synthetase hasD n=1 Tax=Petromyces alliaceus TaxID=209559 RepID=UPI0012A72561|nr:uncharacterized protein BDW43DRAFT_316049 [Aspergillus alliaceus]KAB8228305.1 hypothetical protein BDW43DRAFT_316049 [Aspergillus alliaceus]